MSWSSTPFPRCCSTSRGGSCEVRGDGDDALWHVDELPDGGADLLGLNHARDLRTQVASLPAPFGVIAQDDGLSVEHVDVPDGDLTHDLAVQVLARARRDVVVTPWRSLAAARSGGGRHA